MKTLKQEEVQGLAYKDADDARRRIGTFIDTVYNTQRLHSTHIDLKNTANGRRLALDLASTAAFGKDIGYSRRPDRS